MVNSRIIQPESLRRIVIILVASLALVSCTGLPAAPEISSTSQAATPELLATSIPVPLPATSTASSNQPANSQLEIPPNWYSTTITLPNLDGLLFVKHDPADLANFDDPILAVPEDFAGGALLRTPLPQEADLNNLQASMEADLSTMTDQDFEAMLIGADQVGLINLAAVSHGRLRQARLDALGEQPAILLEGTIHFNEDQPPILHGQIWLAWTDKSFITFYALGTEVISTLTRTELENARHSVRLP